MEKKCAKLRVLPLSSMCSVKEPDRCINTNTKTMKISGVGLKSINDSNVGKRT
jgi:hypothetical protein